MEQLVGFNRTFMELKYDMRDYFEDRDGSFNRTFMELKYSYRHRGGKANVF